MVICTTPNSCMCELAGKSPWKWLAFEHSIVVIGVESQCHVWWGTVQTVCISRGYLISTHSGPCSFKKMVSFLSWKCDKIVVGVTVTEWCRVTFCMSQIDSVLLPLTLQKKAMEGWEEWWLRVAGCLISQVEIFEQVMRPSLWGLFAIHSCEAHNSSFLHAFRSLEDHYVTATSGK